MLPNGNIGLGWGPQRAALAVESIILYGSGEVSRIRTDEGKEIDIRKQDVPFLILN